MPERKLVDIDQAQTYTAPNGAKYRLRPSSAGTLLNGGTEQNPATTPPASSEAIAMWKASDYATKDIGFLLDTTGNGHHMRFGSQHPAYIAKGALHLPGVEKNYVSTPDSAATSITGDIDVRVLHSRPAWDDSGVQPWIIGKLGGATQSYRFDLFWPMDLRLTISLDGTATTSYSASAALPNPGPGATIALRFTRVAASGDINYYYATDFNISTGSATWQQVGTTVSSPAGGLFDSSSDTYIGHPPGAGTKGTYYYAEIRSGINGDVVAKFDPSGQPDFTTSFNSITGEVWTINRPGAIIKDSGLYFDGQSTSFAKSDYSSALDISGDITLIVKAKIPDWTPASGNRQLIYHGIDGSTDTRGIGVNITSSNIQLRWYDQSLVLHTVNSSISNPISDGATKWLKVTLDVDNGAAGHTVRFWQSDDNVSYSEIGSAVVTAGTTDINTPEYGVDVGAWNGLNTTQLEAGSVVYRAIIKSGIDGTTVFDADFSTSSLHNYTKSFTCTTGQKVTLNGQTGSDTNDPLYLAYSGSKYLYLPGVSGNYLSVPDEAALDITGDLDLRIRLAADDWTPTDVTTLITKWGSSNNSYQLDLNSSGTLQFYWSTDGSSFLSATSSVATSLSDGTVKWIRSTIDVDNGAAGRDVKFYTSDDGTSWTQLGATQTSAGVTTIFSGTANLKIGSGNTGAAAMLSGKVYRAIVKSGIDGTTVLDVDSSLATATATTFLAATGQTVTINRATSGRKLVVVDRSVLLFGGDDFLQAPDNDQLDFGVSDSLTMVAVLRKSGTQGTVHGVLAKQSISDSASYSLLVRSGRQPKAWAHNGSSYIEATSSDYTDHQLTVLAGRLDRASNQMTLFVNGVAGTPLSITGSLANNQPLRIGGFSDVTSPYTADMEFVGAAIWRRALTNEEIGYLAGEFGV